MSYLDNYKKGGARRDVSKKKQGSKYLNKKDEHEFRARIEGLRKFASKKPKDKGKEIFICEFTPVKIKKTTQKGKNVETPLEEGEAFVYMIKIDPNNGLAIDYQVGEMFDIVAACAGTTPEELWRAVGETEAGQPSMFDDLLADDGAAVIGNLVDVKSLEEDDRGYHNLEWSGVSA